MRSEGLLESDCVALYPILSILDFFIRTQGTLQIYDQPGSDAKISLKVGMIWRAFQYSRGKMTVSWTRNEKMQMERI